jgi:hypothetical protein
LLCVDCIILITTRDFLYGAITIWRFSFQGAQAVGMGKEALNVQAAAELFNKANDILGYLQNSYMIYLFPPIGKLKREKQKVLMLI